MESTNLNRFTGAWKILLGLLEAAKPEYWLKPLAVMLVASTYALGTFPDFSRFLYGFLIVGPLLWGGLYILNDITDKKEHSRHLLKRLRPFSAGLVDVSLGMWVSSLMIGLALLLGLMLGKWFTLCLVLMCIKQLAYCLPGVRLKERYIWDVASGSLGNASLRFAAGWFLFSDSLEMPLLLLFFAECLQLAGFFVNRLHTNHGNGIGDQPPNRNTTSHLSARQLKSMAGICGSAAILSFILMTLNGQYRILPAVFGELPIQALSIFLIFLFSLPLLAKTIQPVNYFSAREASFYSTVPLLIALVASVLLSFIIKYYGQVSIGWLPLFETVIFSASPCLLG